MGNVNRRLNVLIGTTDKLLEIEIGTKINDNWTSYLREIRKLGSGAFGIVYLAESRHDGKLYVVKEMLA